MGSRAGGFRSVGRNRCGAHNGWHHDCRLVASQCAHSTAKTDGPQNPNYSLSGFRNQANPDGPVPVPFGTMRYAPPYAALPYTEVVGNIQYIRALFVWGYGPLSISDLQIGDTSLSEYDEFQVETYSGLPGDPQVTLYPQQVLEEGLNVELTRAWAKDDAGNLLVPNHTIEKPWVRYTASDVTEAAVIIGFPGGLMTMTSSGKRNNRTVNLRIRQRALGSTGDWSTVTQFDITDASSVPIWRQFRWTLPTRGAYEVELTRMSDESQDTSVSDRMVWQALQSYRPEYPINFPHPIAVTAMRVKATAQLNGNLDTLTGKVSRIAPDWDQATQTWITRPTRSPAAALRWALQQAAFAQPLTDSELDLDLLADWSDWCAANSLYYDRVHDQEGSIGDAVRDIAHAGRASIRHDGVKTGVVIDRPQSIPVDEISPRNSRDFKWKRAYPQRPDGFRISFNDSSNSYHKGERIVPWPGHTGSINVTEELSLPGKVDPSAIWIEARRKAYEVDLRPDVFSVTQDGAARVATRGDLVNVSYYILDRRQFSARVLTVSDQLILLDDEIEMVDGTDYAVLFRSFDGDSDAVGSTTVLALRSIAGRNRSIVLKAPSSRLPLPDDIVHVGPLGEERLQCRIKSEERADNNGVTFTLVAAAPEIDTLLAADTPPPYDGRTGATSTAAGSTLPPTAPVISSTASGLAQTGDANGLMISLRAGSGTVAPLSLFEVDHRLSGTSTWTILSVPAASGATSIAGYTHGQSVDIQVRAKSLYGAWGPYGDVVTVAIGANDIVVPDITALSVSTLSDGSRRFTVGIPTSSSLTLVGYALRARPGTGWTWSQLAPLHTGYLTSSPADMIEPLVAGSYTIGAVAIDATGAVSSNPLLITATIGNAASMLAQRIESALAWPGSRGSATLSGTTLVGPIGSPSVITYTTPVIDLGSDQTIAVSADVYGVVGSATVSMRVGRSADGAPVGAAIALGNATARYIQITVSVSNSAAQAQLGDVGTLIVGRSA